MTTISIILNAMLAAALITGLVLVLRVPYRLRRSLRLSAAVYVPRHDEDELSRAA